MSDQWYYYHVEGEAARGPMTLAELASILARFSDPYRVPVWRPGFERWQWAHDVRDVAAALAQRRGSDPSLLTPRRRAAPSATTPVRSVEPKLSGIGGWLILMAIGQGLWLLGFLVSKIWYYWTFDTALFEAIPIAMLGDGIISLVLALLYAYTVMLFFNKSRRYPRFFIYQIVAAALSLPVSAAWIAVSGNLEIGASVWLLFENAFGLWEAVPTFIALVAGCVGIPYILKSRRVTNTFVR